MGSFAHASLGHAGIAEQAWHLVQMRNVTRIVDKMLRNAFNLGYIQLALPRSCVIHTVRHPLDVALSCFSQPFEGRGLPWAAQLDGASPCQIDCVTGSEVTPMQDVQRHAAPHLQVVEI